MALSLRSGLTCSIALLLFLSACQNKVNKNPITPPTPPMSKEGLGERLFNDKALSKNGTQSCASCHDQSRAFIDSRVNHTSFDTSTPGSVSLGQDNETLGDINTPTLTYAALVPEFIFDRRDNSFKGGMFMNGRALNLTEQAKHPFVDATEMQNTKEAVVATVKSKYGESMKSIYGNHIFNSTDKAYHAIADSLAAFQSTDQFASFDSKFDKVLRGNARFTAAEQRGHDLFIGNCTSCHTMPTAESTQIESLFTNFAYENLGVPKNQLVRHHNGKARNFVDNGLFNHPNVNDRRLKGAFRVPTLRNVAVTPPYMHNGVFRDLSTVVHFYSSRDLRRGRNPETRQRWRLGEVEHTKNTAQLGSLGLSNADVNDIVTFLHTLTDERFEHLIPRK